MAREILFSDFECDCGHRSSFGEGTVNECKEQSLKRPVHLADSERNEHVIIFRQGRAIAIECPKLGTVSLVATDRAEQARSTRRRVEAPQVDTPDPFSRRG